MTFTDDVERGGRWVDCRDWQSSTGTAVTTDERYYLVENRQYVG